MKSVRMFGTRFCPYCVMARRLLKTKGVAFEDIRVDEHPEQRAEMQRISGRYTVPQIFVDDHHVGGCDDLYALERSGKLDPLLQENQENDSRTE